MAQPIGNLLNFTEENQYSISALIPTRKRPEKLKRSIASLIDTADDPSRVQIMVAFDRDDDITRQAVESDIGPWLEQRSVPSVIVAMERQGYAKLQNYYNELAKRSSCDWYFMWGDDSVIKTQGWDTIIGQYTGQFKILRTNTHNQHPYSIFPIIPREWYKLIGMLSNHQMGDAVISQMAYQLDIMENVSIEVDHNRFDLLGEKPDEVYQERQLFEGNPNDPRDLNHISNVLWRMSMCDRIAWYLQEKGQDVSWWIDVKKGLQDPWVKLRANDVNKQTHQSVRIVPT